MLVICLSLKEAREVSKNGVRAVYPNCPETLRLLKLFMKVNQNVQVLNNAILWNNYDPARFNEIRKKFERVLADLNDVSVELSQEVKKVQDQRKNNKKEVKK